MDASGTSGEILLPDLLSLCREALAAADDVTVQARRRVTDMCTENGKVAGALVDANLEEASARLQALQVQQQLGIQALSIANQAPQQLLSLFR